MAGISHKFFIIKATSKVTGNIHYVKVDYDYETIELVKHNTDGSFYNTYDEAEKAIKEYCDGEKTHDYTVDSITLSEKEFLLSALKYGGII